MSKFFCFLLLLFLISCAKNLDLSKLELGKDAAIYNLGDYKSLSTIPSSSNIVTEYSSKENLAQQINFSKIPIDGSFGINITIYKKKIASFRIVVKQQFSFEFAKKLMDILGKPTIILNDKETLNDSISTPIFNSFKSVFPDNTQWVKEEVNTISYPYLMLWDKDDIYYVFSLNIDGNDGRIRNQYYPLTKEAFRSNVVFGYQYPTQKESPLVNYLK